MKCNACGRDNPQDAAFCSGCGAKMETENKCPKCGRENQPDSAFCSGCGEKMGAVAPAPTMPPIQSQQQTYTPPIPQMPPTQRTTSKKIPKKPLLAAIAAVLVVAIVSGVFMMSGSVKVTAVEAVGKYQDGMLLIKQNEKFGFMDTNGLVAIPAIYEDARLFENGTAQVKYDGGWKEIDRGGNPADTRTDREPLFIDMNSFLAIPYIYDGAEDFHEGFARVRKGDAETGKYGFIDTTGKEVVPLIYDGVEDFSEGFARVRKGDYETGKWGFIDTTGKEVVPLIYDGAGSFSEGFACVRKGDYQTGKYGFVDTTGKEVVPLIYDGAEDFHEGFARVRKGDLETGKWGFVDTTGKEVVPLIYDATMGVGVVVVSWDFNEGFALVRKGGKYGFVDTTGKEAIPLIYDDASAFSEGYARVRKGSYETGKYGFIDKTGKEVVPLIYGDVRDFSHGFASVATGDYETSNWGLVDTEYNEVIPLIYDYVVTVSENCALVLKDGKQGFIDTTGKEVVPLIYDNSDEMFGLICAWSEGGEWALYTTNAEKIWSGTEDEVKGLLDWYDETNNRISEAAFSILWHGYKYTDTDDEKTVARLHPMSNTNGKYGYISLSDQFYDDACEYINSFMFAAKSGENYSELYNAYGNKVATFDKDLDKFSANFAKGAELMAEGKTSKAKKYLKIAQKLQPDNPYVSAMLNGTTVIAADIPSNHTAAAPAGSAGFNEKFNEAVALYQSESPDAPAAMEALFTEYPQEERLYSFLADEYEKRGSTADVLSILMYGHEVTGSQALRDRFDKLVLEHDLGEHSDELQTAMALAEKLAEATGKSEDFEQGRDIAKGLYEAYNGFRFGE